jgi:hypothetical protein
MRADVPSKSFTALLSCCFISKHHRGTNAFLSSPSPSTRSFHSIGGAAAECRRKHGKPGISTINYAAADDQENDDKKDSTSWLKEAMGLDNEDQDDTVSIVSKSRPLLPLSKGLAGFAVDPEVGFVAVLAGEVSSPEEESSQQQQTQRATFVVISPNDFEKVSSPEAFCMVQLAGGLDLGTAVLPPDALAKLAAGEVDEVSTAQELRNRMSLVQVDVLPNEPSAGQQEASMSRENVFRDIDDDNSYSSLISSPEREAKIVESAPKVLAAVKNLPGLTGCSLADVLEAAHKHADETGAINQTAFSFLLETLRQTNRRMAQPPKVQFKLSVNLIDPDKTSQHTIPAPTMEALGLSMRYKVPLVVDSACFTNDHNGFDASSILEKFPAFRPLSELFEDAAIMGGFVPSMFAKAAALDNDQKL